MGLMSPGVGGLGEFVTGTSVTASSIANGGTGKIGQITIPSNGIWIFTASGWMPSSIGANGYVQFSGMDTCGTGGTKYIFNIAGILKTSSAPKTFDLNLTNWSGAGVENVNISSLNLCAVKVGEV